MPMFSKQHYGFIADVLARETKAQLSAETTADMRIPAITNRIATFVDAFAHENPHFNKEVFVNRVMKGL